MVQKLASALLFALALSALAGCTSQVVDADVLGRWSSHPVNDQISSLEIRADGTFLLDKIPLAVIAPYGAPGHDSDIDVEVIYDLTGQWHMVGGSVLLTPDSPTQLQTIAFVLSPVSAFGELSLVAVFTTEGEDRRLVFERTE